MRTLQILSDVTNDAFITETKSRIDDARTHRIEYYEPDIGFSVDGGTAHLSVMAADGTSVALTSSVNGV